MNLQIVDLFLVLIQVSNLMNLTLEVLVTTIDAQWERMTSPMPDHKGLELQ